MRSDIHLLLASACFILFPKSYTQAHEWQRASLPAPGAEREVLRAHLLEDWKLEHAAAKVAPVLTQPVVLASNVSGISVLRLVLGGINAGPQAGAPMQAAAFQKFPKLNLRWDQNFIYVESNGLPDHNMMVGITAWQQQVPLPQPYTGDNAWRVPLHPVPSKTPVSIKGKFLRGAIALAANGIPIFNPENNRGEVSQEIGELDQWGGHCGRADDYHYHAAPLHLQAVVGKGLPIAYALDGYPIYGLTEPDGAPLGKLDEFNGHETAKDGYHYHASTKYPYVNGGFHGEVAEAEGQVDPQPRANSVRKDQPPLRGAKITDFKTNPDGKLRNLTYTIGGKQGAVNYLDMGSGTWKFQFVSTDGQKQEETYQAREGRGGGAGMGGQRPRDGGAPPRDGGGERKRPDGQGGQGVQGGPPNGGREQQESASKFGQGAMKKPNAAFVLTSPEVKDDGALPMDYTGDGSGATLPLSWTGAPAGTKSYALIMDHLAPGNVMKHYWTMWDIPASTTSLPKNAQGIGKVGASFKGQIGYEPPHSQGPGAKTYVLTVYALSSPLQITQSPRDVNRDVMLEAMKDKVLATASLDVIYSRDGSGGDAQRPPRPREVSQNDTPPPPPVAQNNQPSQLDTRAVGGPVARPQGIVEQRGPGGQGKGKGGGGNDDKGLIKPRMDDTVHVDVYADNWFAMFINGELVAVDSIKFTPHNVQSFDILPEYPMTIAIIAKDNADPKTGLEYGDHIGDGGFIVKFSDGTTSNAKWKAMNFFKGPINHDAKNPQVVHTPIPDGWWKVGFDDSKWPFATEYTEERVNPKEPFYKVDFSGAKWVWSEDLDLDNTVIFRTVIEKPGWVKRWNTKPDIDISGAPFK